MNTDLRLILSSATTHGEVDLSGFEQITLKKSVSDIKDLSKRNSSHSQTFTVNGTDNNNKLFNHIFEIGSDSTYDSRKKALCWLLEDSISVMDGVLQLTNISVDDQKKVTYELLMLGETSDLFLEIGEGYIEELDYSDLNHTLSFSAVTNSWTGGTNYYYGLIDYGYDLSISDLDGTGSPSGLTMNKIFPSINVKYIFDKIMAETGKSYKSTFLTGSTFSNLWIPFNGDASGTQDEAFINSQLYRAATTGNTYVHYSAYTQLILSSTSFFNAEYRTRIPASNDSTNGNFDNGNLYDALLSYQYTGDSYSVQRFTSVGDYELLNSGQGSNPGSGGNNAQLVGFSWHRDTYGAGGIYPFYESYLTPPLQFNNTIITQTPFLNGAIGTQYGVVQPGEKIWCNFLFKSTVIKGTITGGTGNLFRLKPGAYIYNEVTGDKVLNSPVVMQQYVPKKIKKVDFIKSVLLMFNLIVEPDRDNTNTLLIEPVNTYYASGQTKDWTEKIDPSKKVTVGLVSATQPKKTIFSYKADKDYLNEFYTESLNRTYGDYIYDNDNDFNKEEKRIEVIFSPTPCDNIRNSDNVIVPKIYKKETNGTYGRTDHNIRILQKSLVEFSPTGQTNFVVQSQNAGRFYPALNHLNHPFTGTTDINWGANDYVYWTLNSITENNLFNTYWKKSFDEYNEKDARIITAYFNLTAADINQFKFSDRIYVKGLTTDGGHYFKVNSIDYSPTSEASSKVELIKIIETTVTASTKTIYKKETVQTQSARSSLALGGSQNYGKGSLSIGDDNISLSDNSFILGNNNTIQNNSPGSFVFGSGNTIAGGVTGATVFGNNISATTSDTTYVTNLIVGSGFTFNGLPFTSYTNSTEYITSGASGYMSIKANNDSDLRSTGDYSFAIGNNTRATGTGSFACGFISSATSIASFATGSGNLSSGIGSFAGGVDNKGGAGARASFVFGSGHTITSTGEYSAILGGTGITVSQACLVAVPDLAIKKHLPVPTATADSVGTVGQITWDDTYLYLKTNTGWGRIALSSF